MIGQNYHYQVRGRRIGPVTSATLKGLFDGGQIDETTLVWTPDFDQEWRPYNRVEGLGLSDEPPLPTKPIPGHWFYLIVAAPFLLALVRLVIEDASPSYLESEWRLFMFYWGPIVILSGFDTEAMPASGRHKRIGGLRIWALLIVPVYIILRARRTGLGLMPILGWAAAVVGGLWVSGLLTFDGRTYLGFGLPSCDSRSTIRMIEDLYSEHPFNVVGAEIVDVTDIQQASYNEAAKRRTCQALVMNSVVEQIHINYSISSRGELTYYQLDIKG